MNEAASVGADNTGMSETKHSGLGTRAPSPAVAFLLDAHRAATRPPGMPPTLAPSDVAQALRIQAELVDALGEPVAGWKVSLTGEPMRAPILRSRLHTSPVELPSNGLAPFGIEAEIAFRFERSLPPREEAYSFAEFVESVVALPAIEVVSSRFADYGAAPPLERLCDLMSNGGLVVGEPVVDWAALDFARLPVRLMRNGGIVLEREGGHPQSDPCGWGLALVNALRRGMGVPEGLVVTTGSFTGIVFGAPGEAYRAEFAGFAPVSLQFS
ncbi:2-keto-4-pentenoate hydratase [Bosea beijingensis]|uniref:2-keto-4-pentenoate hydratase n=1 Tax=Bosea beijingensis TaxID=3068632 RepID=UPI0027427929|nr:hypothetical protein [Bosea sp. REN20]